MLRGRGIGRLCRGGGVADLFGQVLGEIAEAPARVSRPDKHAPAVELGPEPAICHASSRGTSVEGVVPPGEQLLGRRVKTACYVRRDRHALATKDR